MKPSKESGLSWSEVGRHTKEILLEPITFAKELRKKLGYNSPLLLLPAAIPFVSGFSIAIHHNPVAGIVAGVAEWVFMGAMLRQVRTNPAPRS